ncbi:DUF547 domain-containing protein [Mariprofundus sp. EBB-1]|uniref:DUF547 domain-containing protein n=1 Tax=Mariprofundus sp. EBB-1 TaxID=2650971 RepID=UPI000EF211AA|nr:DUF547 domain-containing protein [Mariprofundus sp. EBB-1]RLL51316.1 DUF547 domain-containing protein [Mariprofundus sp. EBB-1]
MIKHTLLKLCIGIFLLLPTQALAAEPDWSTYTQLLQAHVGPGNKQNIALNLVDYQNMARDPRWPKVLNQLATFDVTLLVSDKEKLAFWINAYNILAIQVVLDHWPLDSIRDAGGLFSPVWKKPAAIVAGKMRTLYQIEHQILRPMGEPRIHFAIVCASVSCPDLKNSAYTAADLNNQLDQQAQAFINHPDKGVRVQGNSIHTSKIFDWFEGDFKTRGGVISFIRTYREDIASDSKAGSYLDYNWALNGQSSVKTL